MITAGVTPSLHVDYKHTTIKQYHKEGRALRTETTINDTRDFGIGKRLTNLPALPQIGYTANRRLLASNDSATTRSAAPTPSAASLTRSRAPTRARAGVRRPSRSHALLRRWSVPAPDKRVHQPRPSRPPGRMRGKNPVSMTAGQNDLRPTPPTPPG